MASSLIGVVDKLSKLSKAHVPTFREFDALVKAIGECKSKAEEDRIMLAEVELLKLRLSDPRLDRARGREYMVRVLYCEMLGHDVSFALIPCVQLASDPNILTKKARRFWFLGFVCRGGGRGEPCAVPLETVTPTRARARVGREREERERERQGADGDNADAALTQKKEKTSRPPQNKTNSSQAAYLALTQLLDRRHDLVLLLVNTLLGDMRSDNFVVAAAALTAATRLVGPDLVGAVLPVVRFCFLRARGLQSATF